MPNPVSHSDQITSQETEAGGVMCSSMCQNKSAGELVKSLFLHECSACSVWGFVPPNGKVLVPPGFCACEQGSPNADPGLAAGVQRMEIQGTVFLTGLLFLCSCICSSRGSL